MLKTRTAVFYQVYKFEGVAQKFLNLLKHVLWGFWTASKMIRYWLFSLSHSISSKDKFFYKISCSLVFFLTSIRFIRYKVTDMVLICFLSPPWITKEFLKNTEKQITFLSLGGVYIEGWISPRINMGKASPTPTRATRKPENENPRNPESDICVQVFILYPTHKQTKLVKWKVI